MLDKRGNSDSQERMNLVNEFLQRFGERQITCLTADREFVGKAWLSYLLSDPLTPFRIRAEVLSNQSLAVGTYLIEVLWAEAGTGSTSYNLNFNA